MTKQALGLQGLSVETSQGNDQLWVADLKSDEPESTPQLAVEE
jgi:hypothetical protein